MVYVIAMEGTDFIKIGYTNDISKRIKQLQCGNPVNLILEYEISFGDIALEKALHKKYEKYRINTKNLEECEWFKRECLKDLINLTDDEMYRLVKEYDPNERFPPNGMKVREAECSCKYVERLQKQNDKLNTEVRNKRIKVKELEKQIKHLKEQLIFKRR